MVLSKLMKILSKICQHRLTSSLIHNLDDEIKSFMELFNSVVPITEHDIVFHMIVHMPEQLKYFGPVRTYWMFYFERYTGYLASHIHNLKVPEANLINASKLVINYVVWKNSHDDLHLLEENLFEHSLIGPKITSKGKEIQINKNEIHYALYCAEKTYKPLYDEYQVWCKSRIDKNKSQKKESQKKEICPFHCWVSKKTNLTREQSVWKFDIPKTASK
jgi:hypothetical protein